MARIEQSIEINVPVSTAYRQLTQFEEYPQFMEDVEEVRQLDDTHLHWHARAGNLDMEWDAEITQQVPDRCIAWRNLNGPRYEGKIELRPTETNRTEVTLTMECDPKQQVLVQHGDAQKVIAERTGHDLARFKKFIEKLGVGSRDWLAKIKESEPPTIETGAAHEARKPEPAIPDDRSHLAAPALDAWQAVMRSAWTPGMMNTWADPLAMMRRMSEDLDRMIGRTVGVMQAGMPQRNPAPPVAKWTPPVEVVQRDSRFIVCAELAGVRREDVSVEVSDGRLTIEGERRQDPSHGTQERRRSERSYGHFYRVIEMPAGARGEAASASLQDGVLEITVPVVEGGRNGRRIEVRSRH